MGQDERHFVAGGDRELADGFHVLAVKRNRRAEQEHVWSRDSAQ